MSEITDDLENEFARMADVEAQWGHPDDDMEAVPEFDGVCDGDIGFYRAGVVTTLEAFGLSNEDALRASEIIHEQYRPLAARLRAQPDSAEPARVQQDAEPDLKTFARRMERAGYEVRFGTTEDGRAMLLVSGPPLSLLRNEGRYE